MEVDNQLNGATEEQIPDVNSPVGGPTSDKKMSERKMGTSDTPLDEIESSLDEDEFESDQIKAESPDQKSKESLEEEKSAIDDNRMSISLKSTDLRSKGSIQEEEEKTAADDNRVSISIESTDHRSKGSINEREDEKEESGADDNIVPTSEQTMDQSTQAASHQDSTIPVQKTSVVTVSDSVGEEITPKVSTASSSPAKRVSSSRRRMEEELERLRQAEENERARAKAVRKKEVKKAVSAILEEKRKKGVTLTPDVEVSRAAIRTIMREEERNALEKEQKVLRRETKTIKKAIDQKYALKDKKQGHDLMALAKDFYKGKAKDKYGLSEQVKRELTREEIKDLKMVFDMFDIKGRGFITANDVRRAASMLGFKAKKEVFASMIEEVTGNSKGRVTLPHFLQFVVMSQGDGDDPLEDILQGFRLLDSDRKGYVTAEDIRRASDDQKLSLSNRAIREMVQEADMKGDSKVTAAEFIRIMLETSTFSTAPASAARPL